MKLVTEEDMKPGRIVGLMVGWVIFICSMAMVGWAGACLYAALNDAEASAAATAKVLGIASSKNAECEGKRRFAEYVAQQRENGESKETVVGAMLARSLELGWTADLQKQLVESVGVVWEIPGTAQRVSRTVMLECLEGLI